MGGYLHSNLLMEAEYLVWEREVKSGQRLRISQFLYGGVHSERYYGRIQFLCFFHPSIYVYHQETLTDPMRKLFTVNPNHVFADQSAGVRGCFDHYLLDCIPRCIG